MGVRLSANAAGGQVLHFGDNFDDSGLWVTVLLKECFGVIPRIAAVCGFLVSIMISYTFATLWIFDEHRFDKRVFEVLGYLFVTIVGAGLTWSIMFLGVNVIGIHYIIVKVFAVGVVTIWNFCAKKVLVFTRKK